MRNDILSDIQRLGIPYREHGDEIQLAFCPYCEGDKKTDRPYGHFSINRQRRVFSCNHVNSCGARGTFYKLLLDRGLVNPLVKAGPRGYSKPKADPGIIDDETLLAELSKVRGISVETLKKWGVKFKKDSKGTLVVFEYCNAAREVVNRKVRDMADKSRTWTEAGAEQIPFGLQFIDTAKPEVHVVEGEYDAIAADQIGLKNVLSVAFGAGSYSPAMDAALRPFKTVNIIFDVDEVGQGRAYTFAKKAGLHRCRNVVLPYKDINDCLREGLDVFDLGKCITAAHKFTCTEIVTAADLGAQVIDHILDPRKHLGTMLPQPGEGINYILGGIRERELTGVIGHTDAGKTTLALNLAHLCEKAGLACMVLAFENQPAAVLTKLIEIVSAEKIRERDEVTGQWRVVKDRPWIEQQVAALAARKLYFLNREGNAGGYYDVPKLLDVMEYAVKFFDVRVFVVDHLHYFLKLSDSRNPVQVIDECVRAIKTATLTLGVHVFLVVHPAKPESHNGKPANLGIYSGKGAASISQEADNFLLVSRPADDNALKARVEVMKNREVGKRGAMVFDLAGNGNAYTGVTIEKREQQKGNPPPARSSGGPRDRDSETSWWDR